MRTERIGAVAEAKSATEANELLRNGWDLYRVFPHPQSGYIMVLVKYVPI